ncbi:MAG TPA: FAD-binding oxidoreductase, partial [Planctomycetaceae bacterium]|nr:FAD-binding oxidoreductase [Planctomycetaceae bacterium]
MRDQLASILPADRIQDDLCALAAFQSDGLTAFAVKPRAVVVPQTADEVVRIVRWCYENRVPMVPRGSGTSLSGGSLPHADGVVIALNRLNRILEIDLENRCAVVQPGVINSKLTAAVEQAGL